jgi:hypothetical protein
MIVFEAKEQNAGSGKVKDINVVIQKSFAGLFVHRNLNTQSPKQSNHDVRSALFVNGRVHLRRRHGRAESTPKEKTVHACIITTIPTWPNFTPKRF